MLRERMNPAVVPAAITILLWSSAFAGIRMGLEAFGFGELTLFRFLVASLALVPLVAATGMPKPDKGDWGKLVLMALSGVTLYHLALNAGEISVNSGTASFIIATSPLFTTLLSAFTLKERIPMGTIGGLAVSFTGIVVMSLSSSGGLVLNSGALYILAAAFLVAIFFIVQKSMLGKYTAIQLTAFATWIGTVPLLLWVPGLVESLPKADPSAIIAVVYIGVLPGAVAYCTWAMTLKHLQPSTASTILYINPCLAVAWGYLLRGEIPSVGQLIGGLTALCGVALVNRSRNQGVRGTGAKAA